jgi:hypothetical protein
MRVQPLDTEEIQALRKILASCPMPGLLAALGRIERRGGVHSQRNLGERLVMEIAENHRLYRNWGPLAIGGGIAGQAAPPQRNSAGKMR